MSKRPQLFMSSLILEKAVPAQVCTSSVSPLRVIMMYNGVFYEEELTIKSK